MKAQPSPRGKRVVNGGWWFRRLHEMPFVKAPKRWCSAPRAGTPVGMGATGFLKKRRQTSSPVPGKRISVGVRFSTRNMVSRRCRAEEKPATSATSSMPNMVLRK